MNAPSWNRLHDKMLEIEARKYRQTGQAVEAVMMAPDSLFEKMKGCTDERIRAIGLSMAQYRFFIRGLPNVSDGRDQTIAQRKRLDEMFRLLPVELFDQFKYGSWDFLDQLMPKPALKPVGAATGKLVAGEYLRPGDMVYINSDGKATKMNQTSAPAIGIVSSVAGPVGADEPVTVMVTKQVVQMAGIDFGFNLDTTQAQEAFKKLKQSFEDVQKSMQKQFLPLVVSDALKLKAKTMENEANAVKRYLDKAIEPEPVIEVIPEPPKGRRRNRVFEDDDE